MGQLNQFLRSQFNGSHSSSLYLWIATIVFAASSALTRKLNLIGHDHLIDGRNPISLCNILFVGNLCALMVMIMLFSKDWTWPQVKKIRLRDWLNLSLIGLISGALVPGLVFTALEQTTVTNVVIISRLEVPISLVLNVVILGIRINRYTLLGAIVSLLGVILTAWLTPPAIMPMMGIPLGMGQGEFLVGISAILLAIANLLSKIYLKTVPLGIFSVVRTGIGTIVFFMIAQSLYGPHHFMDVFSPFLWGWVLVYSVIIVVVGQLCWFNAQKISTFAELTLATSMQPMIAIFMAFIILGEIPKTPQFVGGTVLLMGIVWSAIGTLRDTRKVPMLMEMKPSNWMPMESDFRGV
jgi:drug/metabolite transporter (DMT)-like permease